ncbi:MAG: hypothetical protein ABSB88_24365 [Bryobacteraceae bacterium]
MFTRSLRGAGVAVFFAALVCAQVGPGGHWEGSFTMNNRETGLSLDLAKNAKSEWIASMGLPSENATGLVVMDVAVGTISSPQGSLPVEFKRTGEAKVELIPASPAVSKELEGDWEGSIESPNGAFRLVFHFKNQPDNTVAATVDSSLAASMVGMPLDNVKQTGQKVEFGMKIAGGTFQGSLNKEGTELAGQLIHEANSTPLTLRKR